MSPTETPDSEYVVRRATPGDAPAMLHLLQSAFDRWPAVELTGAALVHLEWKLTSPWTTPELSTVVTCNDEVVALNVRWLAPATINGAPTQVDHTVDLAVAPAHQGRGLGRLVDAHSRSVSVEIGTGEIGMDLVSKSAAVNHMYGGGDVVERLVQTWVRPTSVRATVAQLRHGGTREMGSVALRAVDQIRRVTHELPPGVTIEELSCFDERADELWAAVAPQFHFSRNRDATYLNWRHADRRSGARTILGAFEGERLIAWAVLRPHQHTLRVADSLVHPEHDVTGRALLGRCVRAAVAASASALVSWLPVGDPGERLYRDAGFVRSGDTFLCQMWAKRSLDVPFALIEPLADPSTVLHINMADFDFV